MEDPYEGPQVFDATKAPPAARGYSPYAGRKYPTRPLFGNLDRIQIVKGWLGKDGKLPPVGSTVDVANATWTNTIGDPELGAVRTDPEFDPAQRAFYYARVIEIPTPRWTTIDAKVFGVKRPADVPASIQERAYTSLIWYNPG